MATELSNFSWKNIRLVLVGPLYAGNVGACARVCANFGVSDTWIVAPRRDWKGAEANKFAKGPARAVLANFRECGALADALGDCTAAVGFTRRRGTLRDPTVNLSDLALAVGAGSGGTDARLALVFGREDTGLDRRELLACTHVCSLAVGRLMPSLNLSHAVCAVLSRLFEGAARAGSDERGDRKCAQATQQERFEALFAHWREVMIDAGMTSAGNPDRVLAHLRRALQRAELTAREARIFRGFLSKTQVALETRRRGRRLKPRAVSDPNHP